MVVQKGQINLRSAYYQAKNALKDRTRSLAEIKPLVERVITLIRVHGDWQQGVVNIPRLERLAKERGLKLWGKKQPLHEPLAKSGSGGCW